MKELLPLNLPDKKLMKINRLSIVKDLAYILSVIDSSCQALKGANRIKDYYESSMSILLCVSNISTLTLYMFIHSELLDGTASIGNARNH